jgi:uncharacterized membrane protein
MKKQKKLFIQLVLTIITLSPLGIFADTAFDKQIEKEQQEKLYQQQQLQKAEDEKRYQQKQIERAEEERRYQQRKDDQRREDQRRLDNRR